MPSINKKKAIIIALLLWVGITSWTIFVQQYKIMQDVPKPAPAPAAVSDLTVANLLKDVNAERAKAGVAPLKEDPLLDKSAQMKADEIAKTGVFEHVGKTGKRGLSYINDLGIRCQFIGENLVEDYPTTQASVNGWLGSSAHRATMLDPRYDTTGFGVADVGGHNIGVEHFCDLP